MVLPYSALWWEIKPGTMTADLGSTCHSVWLGKFPSSPRPGLHCASATSPALPALEEMLALSEGKGKKSRPLSPLSCPSLSLSPHLSFLSSPFVTCIAIWYLKAHISKEISVTENAPSHKRSKGLTSYLVR